MFKKFTAFILVIVMMFTSTAVFASYQISSQAITVIEKFITDSYHLEIIEHEGFIHYFYDTKSYIITMQLDLALGELRVYRMDKESQLLTYDVFEMESMDFTQRGSRSSNIMSAMETIKDLVSQDILPLNYEVEFEVTENFLAFDEGHALWDDGEIGISPLSAVTNARVIRELNRQGHWQRVFTNISQLTQQGLTARLYESTTF